MSMEKMDANESDVTNDSFAVCSDSFPLCARLERDTGKNVVSLATEMISKIVGKGVEYVCEETTIKNISHFIMSCSLLGLTFRGDPSSSKKGAKLSCARYIVEHLLRQQAKNPELEPLQTPSVIFERSDTFSELLRQHTYAKFAELCTKYPGAIGTDRVIASIFILDTKGDKAEVVSISTGNKCISGDKLSLGGTSVNDSHAEILCRRGLLRFLYSQILMYYANSNKDCIFVMDKKSGKLALDSRFSFHMFLNTAPCGDARLYTQSEETELVDEQTEKDIERNCEKLRHKIESGMGTVLGDSSILTIDGLSNGQRLKTQSCSDKLMKWSALGMQGALLSHFINPIYLSSLSVADLFSSRITRAVSGRLEGVKLENPFALHNPLCMPCQSISSTLSRRVGISPPSVCSNWNIVDGTVECLNTSTGKVATSKEVSRLSRVAMFSLFSKIVEHVTRKPVESSLTYLEAKASSSAYWKSRNELYLFLTKKGMGKWSNKPYECAQFTSAAVNKIHIAESDSVV